MLSVFRSGEDENLIKQKENIFSVNLTLLLILVLSSINLFSQILPNEIKSFKTLSFKDNLWIKSDSLLIYNSKKNQSNYASRLMQDTDGDGITDNVDLDDDNDGILDIIETPLELELNDLTGLATGTNNSQFNNVSTPSGSLTYDMNFVTWQGTANRTRDASSTGFPHINNSTVNSWHGAGTTSYEFNMTNITAENDIVYFVAAGGDKNKIFTVTVYDVNDDPISLSGINLSDILIFTDQAVDGNAVWDNSTGEFYWEGGSTISGRGAIFNFSYLGVKRINITFPTITSDNFIFALGSNTSSDIDNDGLPNYVDVDSDNDGCPDAIEASGNYTIANLTTSNNLTDNDEGTVDTISASTTYGVPNNGGSQSQGTNANVITATRIDVVGAINPVNSSVNDGDSATFSIVRTATSTTTFSSGIPDYSSGINSSGGLLYLWYLGDPDNGGRVLTTSANYSGQNTATLTINNATGLNGAEFFVRVTHRDNQCLVTKESAILTVSGPCSSGAIYGVSTVNDPDADGIVNSCDLDDDNDGILDAVELCNGASNLPSSIIRILIDLDAWASQTSWNLKSPSGNIIRSVATGSYFDFTDDIVDEQFIVYNSGTYVFEIVDAFSDGLDDPAFSPNGTSKYTVFLDGNTVYDSPSAPSFISEIRNIPVVLTANLCFTADPFIDSDLDGTLNYQDPDYAAANGSTIVNGVMASLDTDGDGLINQWDIDSDNDGIPDNVEAQTTVGYITPNGFYDQEGVDTAYTGGLTPVDTDTDGITDYRDLDSDNDTIPDIEENGDSDNVISGVDSDNDGLDDNFEGTNTNDAWDANDEINNPYIDLPDVDNDYTIDDVDYRDDDIDPINVNVAGNVLWLRADLAVIGTTSVTNWDDQSGSLENATAVSTTAPTKIIDNVNFNPSIRFDGIDDFMEITGGILETGTYKDIWVYTVIKSSINNPGFIFAEFQSSGLLMSRVPVNNTFESRNGTSAYLTANGTLDLNSFGVYNWGISDVTSTPSGFQSSFYKNGFLTDASNSFSTVGTGNNNTFYIGSFINGSSPFTGDIAEIIISDAIPSSIVQQNIQTYLAIKYGITLSFIDNDNSIVEGDYVLNDLTTKVWDYTSNSAFHNNVAGIGRDDGLVLNQKQSKSNNIDSFVTIGLGDVFTNNVSNTNTFSTNEDFLVWGHNGSALATTTLPIPNVPLQAQCETNERLNRVWKIVETGIVGTTEVAFTKSIVDTYFTSTYGEKYLVVADDASFSTNVVEILLVEENINTVQHYSGKHNFDGVKYFTIADKKEIEWLGITSEWKRGSGTNNAPDIIDMGRLLIIDSQGTSNHASLVNNVKVECAYVKANSKLVVGSNNFIEIQDDLVLDGEIRLVEDGQLIQTHSGTSKVHGTGKLYKDQQAKVPNVYRYHYWSSPVVEVGLSTYRVVEILRDGIDSTDETSIPQPITWTTGYDGVPGNGSYPSSYTPITISSHWIYTNLNDPGDGSAWVQQRETGVINTGQGFSMKSTGTVPQNFTFLGTPNDGTITFNIDPEPATHLLGNPYPSALDMTDFINDNITSIDGTLYFWEHTGEDSATLTGTQGHYQLDYQGGYSQRNLTMGISAVNVPTSNSGLYDWENATDIGNDVTQLKTITIDNTDYDITATVSIDDAFGLDIIDKQGAGGSTAKVIVKNSGLSSDGIKITFDILVDVSSIYFYNDIASQIATNDITITADNPSRNTTVTETLTGSTGQIFTLNWTDVAEITITSQNPNNLVLDDISFAKGGGITTGNGTYHEPNRYMAVGQGFFVSASAMGGQIIFQNSQREYQNDDFANGGTYFFKGEKKKEDNPIPILKLGMDFKHNNISYHRQIGISFKEGNTFDYDNGYDSEIFDIGSTDMFWSFDEIPGKKLIIAGVENISDELEVSLEIQIDQDQTIEILIDQKENIQNDLFILDKVTGTFHDLSKSVILNLEKGSYINRFFLVFKDSTLNTENNILLNYSLNIFYNNKSQEIEILNKDNLFIEKVELFDLLGKKIKNWSLLKSSSTNRLKIKALKSIIYIIRVKTYKGYFNQKIFINSN